MQREITNDDTIFAYLCNAHSSALKFRDVKVSLNVKPYTVSGLFVKCYC